MSDLIVCRSLRMPSQFLVALLLTLAGSRAVRAHNFSIGECRSYSDVTWGLDPTAGNLLENYFSVVYASRGATLVVGDTSNFDLLFSSPDAALNYMPSFGPAGPLDTIVDPEI
jgi:hypothetical protein